MGIVVGFVMIALGLAAPASADFFLWEMFVGIGRDIKNRNCWPDQYYPISVAEARAPSCIMVANGWRKQNLLGEYHFQPTTGQLTEAGSEKLRWILTVGPEQHRVVYVHAAYTVEETAARLSAVQQLALKITPRGLPPILTTTISDDGWPADQVDLIGRKYQATMPPPRLPSSDAGGGAGATAGK
jgi:hypothetical protein